MIRSVYRQRIVLVGLVVVASVSLSGCSLLGDIVAGPGDTTDADQGTDTDVFTIGVGDCLNDGSAEGEVSTVKTVPCTEPHDSEAYASIIMDDASFPGVQAAQDRAELECTAEFSAFVGLDYESSTYNFSYYYPTESSWGQGDREILCLIVDPAGKTTGTLQGIAG